MTALHFQANLQEPPVVPKSANIRDARDGLPDGHSHPCRNLITAACMKLQVPTLDRDVQSVASILCADQDEDIGVDPQQDLGTTLSGESRQWIDEHHPDRVASGEELDAVFCCARAPVDGPTGVPLQPTWWIGKRDTTGGVLGVDWRVIQEGLTIEQRPVNVPQ